MGAPIFCTDQSTLGRYTEYRTRRILLPGILLRVSNLGWVDLEAEVNYLFLVNIRVRE